MINEFVAMTTCDRKLLSNCQTCQLVFLTASPRSDSVACHLPYCVSLQKRTYVCSTPKGNFLIFLRRAFANFNKYFLQCHMYNFPNIVEKTVDLHISKDNKLYKLVNIISYLMLLFSLNFVFFSD